MSWVLWWSSFCCCYCWCSKLNRREQGMVINVFFSYEMATLCDVTQFFISSNANLNGYRLIARSARAHRYTYRQCIICQWQIVISLNKMAAVSGASYVGRYHFGLIIELFFITISISLSLSFSMSISVPICQANDKHVTSSFSLTFFFVCVCVYYL